MEHAVERELVVPEAPEEVWRSLSEPEWLGEHAAIELQPAGEVRAGSCSGGAPRARRRAAWSSSSTSSRRAPASA
jgi:hypothetical protein